MNCEEDFVIQRNEDVGYKEDKAEGLMTVKQISLHVVLYPPLVLQQHAEIACLSVTIHTSLLNDWL